MNKNDLSSKASGVIHRSFSRQDTFKPNPLPPTIGWTQELVVALTDAANALGQLSRAGEWLKNPHILINPFIRREAVLSSKIEGTQATVSDLFLFEASPKSVSRHSDVLEVRNYVVALEHGLHQVKAKPLTLNLIREMHAKLMDGVRGQEMTPGEFRKSQNWIGAHGCKFEQATYVPPAPELLPDLLDAFEKYLHSDSDLPWLVRLAFIHYQFEAIHPFNDGNGRLGRLLITLLLCIKDMLPLPLLYLSAYLEKHRVDYYRHLKNVSQHGHWEEWVTFFLRGVCEQALDAITRTQRLLNLRAEYQAKARELSKSLHLLDLIDLLFEKPAIRIGDVMGRLEITHRAANQNIQKLVSASILKRIGDKPKYQVFAAFDIVRVVQD